MTSRVTARPTARPASCQIVPPYLLDRLAASGRPGVSSAAPSAAARTAELDRVHRQHRLELVPGTGTLDRLPDPLPPGAAPRRTVSDAGRTTRLPGIARRSESDAPTGDPAVDETYDGLGHTWSLFADVFGRNSVDGRGLPLEATVHYSRDYDNAFWDGERMVLGDGDGEVFGRFSASLTVIGHELAHGLTQFTSGLAYAGQSGALNESVSDVFGALVEQRALRQDVDEASWLIGAGLFLPAVTGSALRSMKAPGTAYDDDQLGRDPQPADMDGFVETDADNGGVHINSGIPNRAFFLAASRLGGFAWERAGQVWHDACTSGRLTADTDFTAFAAQTRTSAAERFGTGDVLDAVGAAWEQVGVS